MLCFKHEWKWKVVIIHLNMIFIGEPQHQNFISVLWLANTDHVTRTLASDWLYSLSGNYVFPPTCTFIELSFRNQLLQFSKINVKFACNKLHWLLKCVGIFFQHFWNSEICGWSFHPYFQYSNWCKNSRFLSQWHCCCQTKTLFKFKTYCWARKCMRKIALILC